MLRGAVRRAEAELSATEQQARSAGAREAEGSRADRAQQRTVRRVEVLRLALERKREALEDLEEEARRTGVPAEWIR